jgi:hypothetical protein
MRPPRVSPPPRIMPKRRTRFRFRLYPRNAETKQSWVGPLATGKDAVGNPSIYWPDLEIGPRWTSAEPARPPRAAWLPLGGRSCATAIEPAGADGPEVRPPAGPPAAAQCPRGARAAARPRDTHAVEGVPERKRTVLDLEPPKVLPLRECGRVAFERVDLAAGLFGYGRTRMARLVQRHLSTSRKPECRQAELVSSRARRPASEEQSPRRTEPYRGIWGSPPAPALSGSTRSG